MNVFNFGSSSSGNCYLIKFENHKNILIECGVPMPRIINGLLDANLTLNDIKYCIYSHKHWDHYQSAKALMKKGVILIDKSTTLDGILVKAIPVEHGNTNCNAYIISTNDETLFFATDFSKFKDINDLKEVLATPFDVVMIECNWYEESIKKADSTKTDRQKNTHLGLEGCVNYLKAMDLSKTKAIYLLHMSSQYGDELISLARIRGVTNIPTFVCNQNGGLLNG